ncbi:hypothetical protein [Nocardia sp. NPDC006630]|uniref:hypothetical protein n=1 Tax=Nocardia sp. NPDC006630 TaxID=3157181 RepID=UPI0033BB5FEE
MRRPDTAQLRTAWRLIRIPALLAALYLSLRLVLAALSQRHGFGSPDGMGLGYLAVAGLALALRIMLLVIAPAVLAYRIAAWAITRVMHRFAPPASTDDIASSAVREHSASRQT